MEKNGASRRGGVAGAILLELPGSGWRRVVADGATWRQVRRINAAARRTALAASHQHTPRRDRSGRRGPARHARRHTGAQAWCGGGESRVEVCPTTLARAGPLGRRLLGRPDRPNKAAPASLPRRG